MEELYKKLNNNIEILNEIERQISSVELEIYQRTVNKLKDKKLKDMKEYLIEQANLYSQKPERYQELINKNINIYEKEIDKIIEIYNDLYIQTFKMMQNARNNQKIALANIVTAINSSNDNKKLAIACAQKKITYSVIIDECKARIHWCIQNVENDINLIFTTNKTSEMVVYRQTIWNKIINGILNKLYGKSKYLTFLRNYQDKTLKNIKTKVKSKVFEVIAILAGVKKQMEIVKEQISNQYEENIA